MEKIQETLIHRYLDNHLEDFVKELSELSIVYEDRNYPGYRGNLELWNDLLISGVNACSRLRDKHNDYAYDTQINHFYRGMEIVCNLETGTLY